MRTQILRNTRTTDSLRRPTLGVFLGCWRRAFAACALLMTTLGGGLLMWCQTPAPRPADATLGAQTVGRMAFFPDGTAELYGYYTYLHGVGPETGASLFNGNASARTAHFTFRTERSSLEFLPNGLLSHLIARPLSSLGTLVSVYYDPTPEQDFNRPDSFTDGERIATYRVRGTSATIAFGAGGTGSLILALESSRDVSVAGATINLRSLGDQMAVTIAASTPPSFEEFVRLRGEGSLVVPFAGTGYLGSLR